MAVMTPWSFFSWRNSLKWSRDTRAKAFLASLSFTSRSRTYTELTQVGRMQSNNKTLLNILDNYKINQGTSRLLSSHAFSNTVLQSAPMSTSTTYLMRYVTIMQLVGGMWRYNYAACGRNVTQQFATIMQRVRAAERTQRTPAWSCLPHFSSESRGRAKRWPWGTWWRH